MPRKVFEKYGIAVTAVQILRAPESQALPTLVAVLPPHGTGARAIHSLATALSDTEAFLGLSYVLPLRVRGVGHGLVPRAPTRGTPLPPEPLMQARLSIVDAIVEAQTPGSTCSPSLGPSDTQAQARQLKSQANRLRKLWQKVRTAQAENPELVIQVKKEWNRTQNLYHRQLRKAQRLQSAETEA